MVLGNCVWARPGHSAFCGSILILRIQQVSDLRARARRGCLAPAAPPIDSDRTVQESHLFPYSLPPGPEGWQALYAVL